MEEVFVIRLHILSIGRRLFIASESFAGSIRICAVACAFALFCVRPIYIRVYVYVYVYERATEREGGRESERERGREEERKRGREKERELYSESD